MLASTVTAPQENHVDDGIGTVSKRPDAIDPSHKFT
jgi:hypothetical protein